MSHFACGICGGVQVDSGAAGYTAGCAHYPPEDDRIVLLDFGDGKDVRGFYRGAFYRTEVGYRRAAPVHPKYWKDIPVKPAQYKGQTASSSRAFSVGDCVILNEDERPCGRLVCVVVMDDGEYYHCQYLNADPAMDSYNNPPMKNRLERATRLEDFGVVIRAAKGEYWCEPLTESKATYSDGKPRNWQEYSEPVKYRLRPHLAELLWPIGQPNSRRKEPGHEQTNH